MGMQSIHGEVTDVATLDQVLAIQERNGPLKGTNIQKMPTGIINHSKL